MAFIRITSKSQCQKMRYKRHNPSYCALPCNYEHRPLFSKFSSD